MLYGLAVGGLYLVQEGILFPRSIAERPHSSLPAFAERLELRSTEGKRLVGTLIPARGASRGLVLGFPGNAWNADDHVVFLSHRLPEFDIVVFHYRGYAPSEGEPGEAALFADALLIHDAAKAKLKPQRVLVAGFSLGSAVAAYLASRRPVDGLVLATPFDSIEAIAASRYAWAPVRSLLRHPFRSDDHLRGLEVPAAVIMAEDDRVVPRERSLALVRVLRRPVLVETLPGSHNSIYETAAMDDALRRAVDAVIDAS